MRKKVNIIIFLIIGLSFLSTKAQDLHLKIRAQDTTESQLIDAIGYQKNHSSINSIEKEVQLFTSKVIKKGYFNLSTTKCKNPNDSLYIYQFDLGERFDAIVIYYSSPYITSKMIRKIDPDAKEGVFRVSISQMKESLTYLNQKIADQGQPFSSLQLTHIKNLNKHSLSAQLEITSTKKRKIDSIIIKGYEKFPKSFLKNYLRIKPGQLFNKSKLDQKTDALQDLRFAKSVRPPEVLFTKDKTTLYLYLEKENSNDFEGFLGFSTDEETKRLKLDGDINLSLINNLNYGEELGLHYKNNGDEQQEFNAGLKLPFLFNTPFGLNLKLNLFRQDSTYTTNDQTVELTYRLNPKIELNAGYTKTSSNFLLDNNIIAGTNHQDYTSNFYSIGGIYTKHNDNRLLFPVKTNIDLHLALGQRLVETQKTPQKLIHFNGFQIFDLDMRNNIYIANQTGILLSDFYIDNELLRFGGINSIRGFEENSLSATFYSSLQTEYRYLLSSELYAHSIIDYAHFEQTELQEKHNLYSIGFGIGLQTKAGLLRVEFANGKIDGQPFKFSNTKVHLSLKARF